jgi:hypothetical protein
MNAHLRSTALVTWIGLGFVALSGFAAAQPSATVVQTQEATATIDAVDPVTRQVLLRRQDGSYVTVVAGPEVRNFAQMKAGDRVHARFDAALVARLGVPGRTLLSDQDLMNSDTAAPGRKPFGEADLEIRRKIKVTGIDLDHNMLSFVGPQNIPRMVQVRSPQMIELLRALKVGDDVDVAYREASLIEVVPAP